jgi:DNA modification methylase
MDLISDLPEKSQHLIIVDPPYFEVKGGFDFVWPSFDAYLSDVRRWATGIKRVMADNGTLLWWGHAKKIAYSQIVLDEFFNLENSLVWAKTDSQTRRQCFDDARCFAPVTERCLMYSNENDAYDSAELNYSFQIGKKRTELMEPIVGYMISEMEAAGFDCEKVNAATGTKMASHWFARTSQWSLPTREWYGKLRALFNGEHLRKEYEDLRKEYEDLRKEYEDLRKEYEDLRKEYEDLRRPFNNSMKLKDVLEFSQEAHLTGRWDHPTQKPPTLCRALIQTCSRRGQNLLVPFAGSFVEVVEGINLGLNVTASELDPTYYAKGLERVEEQTAQLSLL